MGMVLYDIVEEFHYPAYSPPLLQKILHTETAKQPAP